MPKFKIIVNPISGRGTGAHSIPVIRQTLQEYGLDFNIEQTERPGHAIELTQQAVRDGYLLGSTIFVFYELLLLISMPCCF